MHISRPFDAREGSGLAATFTSDMRHVDPIRRFLVVGNELVGFQVGNLVNTVRGAMAARDGVTDASPRGLSSPDASTRHEIDTLLESDPMAVRWPLDAIERCEVRGHWWMGVGFFRLWIADDKVRKFRFTSRNSSDVGCPVLREAFADRCRDAGIF